MHHVLLICTTFLTSLLFSCQAPAQQTSDSNPPGHKLFDTLLKKYVDDKGLVNYAALGKARGDLKKYLEVLEQHPPSTSWSEKQKLVYWINAYNAYTLDLILEHYPVESIKDIGSKIQIPFVNTAWDVKFINIGGQTLDLNNIEHGIIRKEFDEPRIHFALVCAAKSCPKLRREAYTAEKLEQQLTAAAKDFLSDPTKNEFTSTGYAELSKIFSWYGADFKKKGTLIAFLNKYAPKKLTTDASINYKTYDWSLNEQP